MLTINSIKQTKSKEEIYFAANIDSDYYLNISTLYAARNGLREREREVEKGDRVFGQAARCIIKYMH